MAMVYFAIATHLRLCNITGNKIGFPWINMNEFIEGDVTEISDTQPLHGTFTTTWGACVLVSNVIYQMNTVLNSSHICVGELGKHWFR